MTVRRIAAVAGCSTIGVYTWFGGKDGLVDTIWRNAFESFTEALETAKLATAPLAKAKGQAMAYRAWSMAHPMQYQLMFMKVIPGFSPSDESIVAAARSYEALLGAVRDSAAKGELNSSDHDAVALTMWSCVHGLVSLDLVGGHTDQPEPERKLLSDRTFTVMIDALAAGLTKQKM